jgi:hypothetical protein
MSLEDDAQAHEAQIWSIINRPREVVIYKPGDKGYGPEQCPKCGDEMHPVRRADGRQLCTPCQSALEISRSRR